MNEGKYLIWLRVILRRGETILNVVANLLFHRGHAKKEVSLQAVLAKVAVPGGMSSLVVCEWSAMVEDRSTARVEEAHAARAAAIRAQ